MSFFANVASKKPDFQAGNNVRWYEIYPVPGIHVEYQTFDGHLKENIIIKNEQAQKSFEFDLTTNFARTEDIELRDDAGI